MKYNFDQIIDRRGSGAIKCDGLEQWYGNSELLPMWVADMDFATPGFIIDAIKARLEHPIFGYTMEPERYRKAIISWIASHHNWQIESDWICYIPGIVKGIAMAMVSLLKAGDKVIIQPPVYHPFRNVATHNGFEVVENPLRRTESGSYEIDFENLEAVADSRCKMLILANPHNPVGILWSRETLVRLADFCLSRGIIVISDEIHCDMALWGKKHIPFASVSDKAAECSITFGAPSKTFNIAGIVTSYAIVPNESLREKFFGWMGGNELNQPDIFAPIATVAAFENGEPWRVQMLKYVEENIEFTIDFCRKYIPQITPIRPEASFLVWLDCRELNLSHTELVELFENRAKLALNSGAIFGTQGEGFMRLNVGTPRSVLEQALQQLKAAVADLE
ncbi:MAG: PatB family C-S lyase [Alistipes sp.]|nr:PatB family C-S lyase [Alistipes sp.]MBQ7952911.1 PatB family C-S lyase [Alistipes sp.]